MRLQLAIGKALEQKNQAIEAARLLVRIREKSRTQERWEIYVSTCLTLARLNYKISRANASKEQLDAAHAVMKTYKLDTFIPEYSIVKAFWHHDFGYPDSIRFYAQQSIDQIDLKEDKDIALQCDYYTVLGLSEKRRNIDASITYLKKAVTFLFHNLSTSHGISGRLEESKIYNDSTISVCYQALAKGQSLDNSFAEANIMRAKKSGNMVNSIRHLTGLQGWKNLTIHRGNFTNSIYFLTVQTSSDSLTQRFVLSE